MDRVRRAGPLLVALVAVLAVAPAAGAHRLDLGGAKRVVTELATAQLPTIGPSLPGLQGRLAGIEVRCVATGARAARHRHAARCAYAINVHEFSGLAHVRHQVCGDGDVAVRVRSRRSRRSRLVPRTHAPSCSFSETSSPPPPAAPPSPSAPPAGTPVPEELPPLRPRAARGIRARAAQTTTTLLGEGYAEPTGCRSWVSAEGFRVFWFYDESYGVYWSSCSWNWFGSRTGTLLLDFYWYWDGSQAVVWFSTIDRPLGGIGVGPWLY